MTTSTFTPPTTADARPNLLHSAIAARAHDLWLDYGRPADRDLAIWLEAEAELVAARASTVPPSASPQPEPTSRATPTPATPLVRRPDK